VDFHSLRHSSNSFLIEEGADPILIARRNGHVDTRMVLDRYGHMFEARAVKPPRQWTEFSAISRLVVKWSSKNLRRLQTHRRRSQKS